MQEYCFHIWILWFEYVNSKFKLIITLQIIYYCLLNGRQAPLIEYKCIRYMICMKASTTLYCSKTVFKITKRLLFNFLTKLRNRIMIKYKGVIYSSTTAKKDISSLQ